MTRASERNRAANPRRQARAGDCVAVGAFWSAACRPMQSGDWASANAFREKHPAGRVVTRVHPDAAIATTERA